LALVKTEAVVLKSIRLRETSKIATLFTSDYGLVSVVAKGSRLPKGKFGAGLEPFMHVSIVLYMKEGRDLQFLSELDVMEPFLPLHRDLMRFAYGSAVVEFISCVVHGEEKNPALYELLLETLRNVSLTEQELLSVLLWIFELKACDILGYKPEFSSCVVCKSDERSLSSFAPLLGGAVCDRCLSREPSAIEVRPEVVACLGRLQRANVKKLETLKAASSMGREITALLDSFLAHHIERYRGLNSARMIQTITRISGVGT
jgi:DNA repair protein RecO (recombination protein O)